ncbi:retrovirus-related Pol polyprotein from transposon 297 [Trichonephila clavipes]|nr:retrovirus-related Pol polyprotein from transposon 297 [Trichonephila clavipes]
MVPSVRYLLAKVHGTIAVCTGTAGGFNEEYCGQMMAVSPIVWQFFTSTAGPEAASDTIASISTAMQGARASFKHGHPARARSSNFPVSSKRLTSFKRPAATEKQKAADLEEKQKAVVVAQQREREFKLEKIKIQLEMQKLSQAPVTSQQLENPKLELKRIIPRFNSKKDEMGLYLTIFEHQAKFLNIPEKTWTTYLIGSLPPDIAQLVAREDEDDAQNYKKIKEMLLKRFRVTGDRFRQYFTQQKKNPVSTWRDFYFELSSYFEGWIKELKITTFDQLKSLIIADQIKRKTPANIKEHFLNIWADLNDPLELAEKLDAYDNLRPGMKSNSNQTFKKKEEFRKPFPLKKNQPVGGSPEYHSSGPSRTVPRFPGYKTEGRNTIRCYGRETPGVIKSKCPKCTQANEMETAVNCLTFFNLN